MSITKNTWDSKDAQAVVIHAKRVADDYLAYPILVDSQGRLSVNTDIIGSWDKVTQTQATLTDTWTFELSSVTTKTVTITYTDSSKETISTVQIT